MGSAIGMLETYGLLPAIEGLDAALKAANVALRSFNYVSGGFIAWIVEGEVGAVRVAVAAGKAAAAGLGKVVSDHVIARPAKAVEGILPPPERPGGRKGGTGIHKREFPAKPGPAAAIASKAAEKAAEKATEKAESKKAEAQADAVEAKKLTREELEAVNVHNLRVIARKTEGIRMERIEIRDAKKNALIEAILDAQEGGGR